MHQYWIFLYAPWIDNHVRHHPVYLILLYHAWLQSYYKRKNHDITDSCKLCGECQTLGHVLNSCKVALQQRRFNNRHDKMLEVITAFVQEHIPSNYQIVSDIYNDQPYNFPSVLAYTDLRPDLVTFSESDKQAILIELTVCCESSFQAAKERKESKYLELVEEVENNGYNVDLITLEVGSRGFMHVAGFLEQTVWLSKTRISYLCYQLWPKQLLKVHTRSGLAETHHLRRTCTCVSSSCIFIPIVMH